MRRIICGIFLLMLVVLTCVGCTEAKTFKVTFKSDFHDEFSKFVKEGDKVEKPEPLVYEGYNFIDWYLGDAPYDFDAEVTKNLTINAMWEKVQGEKYTVTFKDLDDVELNKVTVEKGEKVSKPADPTKEGFTFVGWYSDLECKDAFNFDTEVNTDLVLYAKFEASVVTYNVVFKGFNGVTLATFSIEEGETVPAILVPDAPVVDGYEFVGWDKEFASVTEDLIINALYEVVVSEFTVVFANSELENVIVKDGEKVTKPEDPFKEGFVFVGWFTDEEYSAEYDFDSEVKSNLILYAKYEEIIKYEIIFKGFTDEELSAFKLEVGKIIDSEKIPTPPLIEGYEFKGWYTDKLGDVPFDFSSLINNDLVLYSVYSPLTYEINYSLKGGTCNSLIKEFNYGDDVVLPVPQRKGYKFLGWFETIDEVEVLVESVENRNYNLVAKWEELNKYTVSYDLNGGKFTSQIMNKFDKEMISKGSFTITQQNVYFFEITPVEPCNEKKLPCK